MSNRDQRQPLWRINERVTYAYDPGDPEPTSTRTEDFQLLQASGLRHGAERPREDETGPQRAAVPASAVTTIDRVSYSIASHGPAHGSKMKKPRKRAHYLRHSQRRAIIERIKAGEQQAALAREYKVTRAAVSRIYKNREEILARDVEEESSDDEEDDNLLDYPNINTAVTEICDNVVLLLLTTLRNARTGHISFSRAANRLISILVDESVASLGTIPVARVGLTGEPYTGLERQHDFCGVALTAEALPFTVIFKTLEPGSPVGSFEAEEVFDGFGNPVHWLIRHMDVPAVITDFKVLLFTFLCGDTGVECKAIEALRTLGVNENDIAIVAVQSSSRGLNMITNHYPEIRIITAVIDDQVTAGAVFPGLSAFLELYHTEPWVENRGWDEDEEKRSPW